MSNLFDAVYLRVDLGDYSRFLGPQMHAAQAALYGAHQDALDQVPDSLRRDYLGFQKDGDGYLVWWRSSLMSLVVSRYAPAFQESLAKRNVGRAPEELLQVRLAVVTSLAADSALGTAGGGAVEAKRLVDCAQAKLLQKEFPDQQLVMIVSQYVYDQTIRLGWASGVEADSFEPVDVIDKHGKKRPAHLTAPGRTKDEVHRTVNPSFLTRLRRRLDRGVVPGLRKVMSLVSRAPRLMLATVAIPAAVALAAVLLVPVAFSSTQGNVTTEAATPAGSRPPERPGPATSRSQGERPPLTPQSAPSSTAAADERGPLGNAGHGGVLAADAEGAWLADDQDRRDGAERAWRLTPAQDGGLRLTTGPDAGRALALTLDSASDRVRLRPYADTPGQRWSVVPVHGRDGTFRLHNAARTDGCLSAHGKGGALTVEPCRPGDRTQEWAAR